MTDATAARIITASDELKSRIHDEFATLTVLKAAVDSHPRITEMNKTLVKDFLTESMNTLWDQAEGIRLIDLEDVPDEIIEDWDTIKEMISTLFE